MADPRTNRVREKIKGLTFALGGVFGEGVVDFAKNVEESVKNLFSPGMLFEELGFRYFGPIDGHDLPKLCDTLRFVRGMSGPRVVHVITQKGKGFAFAESNQEKWHGLAAYDPVTGEARKKASGPPTWTQVFGDGLTALGGRAPRAGGDHRGDAERAPAPTSSRRSIPSGSSTSGSPKGTRSPSRPGSPRRASGRSSRSTARSSSAPTTTSSTTSPCSSCR